VRTICAKWERYGHLRIRPGKHRWLITGGANRRAQIRQMREDFSRKDQRRSVRSQAASSADSRLGKRRCTGRYSALSSGAVYARSPKSAGHDCRKGSRLQISQRHLGRHHDGARSLDADCFGRFRRVRARANPDSDRRGARARKGEGSHPWPEAKVDQPSASGSHCSPGGRRSAH
jgi:hypothetical protein